MSTVVVIIVTWNASHLINDVLNALDIQTFLPQRVLLVDNASNDVDELEQIVLQHRQCELIKNDRNLGFAVANNIGIRLAGEVDYIALLNPDAFPEPQWLENLVVAAESNPTYGSFASRLINHENVALLDGAGDFLTAIGVPGRRGHGLSKDMLFLDQEIIFSPCAAAALYSRPALANCGGFDEDYFCYIEDIDLGFRLLLLGYPCLYVPNSIARHMGSALTGRRSSFSVYYGQRNLVFNFIKNMPGIIFWIFLPLHILMNVFSLIHFLFKGQLIIASKAKLDSLKYLPTLIKKRRHIQKTRKMPIRTVWRLLGR